MATNTKNPADNSRICQIARRLRASDVTMISPDQANELQAPSQALAITNAVGTGKFPRVTELFRGFTRLAGEILLEPVDMIVAVDDVGLPDPVSYTHLMLPTIYSV